ncbi:hypothetical protein [Photobacterium frigidiphilum]|uniref:hypothetical protein n=1 Tax=Photobacterium frigidiphilum TaxID=264736 RepID=UPI001475E6F9|nr:hypothetical protein [Photobacterium frigidiphilum]
MSKNEQYLKELLEDIRFLVENHSAERSSLRKQLVTLLNRVDEKGEQTFKVSSN